jgi:hypothetical protein
MTPVKKILYQQEQDLQKTIEINQSNCQQQITQLTFNFIISKVSVLDFKFNFSLFYLIRLIFFLNVL